MSPVLSCGTIRCVLVALLAVACGEMPARRAPVPQAEHPSRVVSLGPAATEIVARLVGTTRLVGRSRWDRTPEAVSAVPEVGDAIRPNVERIVALRPDLVVLYPALDNAEATRQLRAAGIDVLPLRIDRIGDFLHALDTLGVVLGAPDSARAWRAQIRAELDAVAAQAPRGARPTVFVPAWHDPLITVGAGSFLSELLEIAGGRNLYADREEPSFPVSFEDVARRDPDLVLVSPAGDTRLRAAARWQALRAVRNRHVVMIDTTLMSQPSLRLGEAARSLAVRLRAVPR